MAQIKLNVVANGLKKVQKGFTGLLGKLSKGFLSLKGIVATAFGFTAIKRTADYLDNISKLSGVIKESTEDISKLGFAFEQSGLNMSALSTSVRVLSRALAEAKDGVVTYKDEFDKLGINVNTFDSLSLIGKFKAIGVGLTNVKSQTDKLSIAQVLLGRSSARLVPLLENNASSLSTLTTEAEKLGIVVGEDLATAGADFNDNMNILASSFRILVANLLPQINILLKEFIKNISNYKVILGGVVNVIAGAIQIYVDFTKWLGKAIHNTVAWLTNTKNLEQTLAENSKAVDKNTDANKKNKESKKKTIKLTEKQIAKQKELKQAEQERLKQEEQNIALAEKKRLADEKSFENFKANFEEKKRLENQAIENAKHNNEIAKQSTISDVKGTIANLKIINDAKGKNSRKQFERNKKLSIAQATITGYEAVNTAYADPTTASPFLKALYVTSIVASTLAQIKKIKATKFQAKQFGGYIQNPTIVGEAGREIITPINQNQSKVYNNQETERILDNIGNFKNNQSQNITLEIDGQQIASIVRDNQSILTEAGI